MQPCRDVAGMKELKGAESIVGCVRPQLDVFRGPRLVWDMIATQQLMLALRAVIDYQVAGPRYTHTLSQEASTTDYFKIIHLSCMSFNPRPCQTISAKVACATPIYA